ncbi:substrate-binding periplasmic protein [Pseudoduganella sp. OTU4001]|uniref:substrate-binding periplasmic protein n=1 Tax=Pseudoduganella sp. OTU4001 TaxID=3043854 RepID=UPI00313D5832
MRLLPGLMLVALGSLPVTPCRAGEPLTVFYNVRPPYLVQKENGVPSGLTGTPAQQAFERAGIPVHWSVLPTNRQILMIRENGGRYCAIGWFQTPERDSFAKFTKPLYRDQAWMVLVHGGMTVAESDSLSNVLARPGLRVMVKDKYSYGRSIDELLVRYKPAIAVSTGTTLQMLQSLGARSVDLIFVSEEEGRYLMANTISQAGKLRLLRLADMPKGETRHIMCSRGVPDEVIDKLNKSIRFNR